MPYRKGVLLALTIALLLSTSLSILAQQTDKGAATIVTLDVSKEAPKSISDLLAEKLAGAKATSEIRGYKSDNLTELVAGEESVYQEYKVKEAASRLYGSIRIDLFQTENPFGAFGLYTYCAGHALYKAQTR